MNTYITYRYFTNGITEDSFLSINVQVWDGTELRYNDSRIANNRWSGDLRSQIKKFVAQGAMQDMEFMPEIDGKKVITFELNLTKE